jgi:hypothetical protein
MSNMEGGMLDRSKMAEAKKARIEAEDAAAGEKPKEGVLDRSKMSEARDARIEAELSQAAEKPKEEVLDRTLMYKQREAADAERAQEIKGDIEERLSAVEEKIDDKEKPFSKEGLLNRNFGK